LFQYYSKFVFKFGWNLKPNYWLQRKTREQRVEVGNLVQSLLAPVFSIEHSKTIHLGDLKDALLNFKNESATNNKILVRTTFG
jgi:hypothetical protein